MSPLSLTKLPPELRLRIYTHIFITHFDRSLTFYPSYPFFWPEILESSSLIRHESLPEYRAFLAAEQERLEELIAGPPQGRCWHGPPYNYYCDQSYAECWSLVRMERERVRFFDSGEVALRGSKGNV
ncbi:unnamed protein product [Zymoseptoria tritici ST99CH_1A5]|uniref:F-box domain-containing protein n=1 Tax=Zymoseptoria tritici ST99CH_1A5 TaxID=1276529 RepID=A0A1Y6LYL4_ZYMTR|nr:unnamed protein product [Zymoseptoria tritici ST99CH_1A5]